MELIPQLLKRQQEEQIAAAVSLPNDWLEDKLKTFLGDQSIESVLESKGWSHEDLNLHLRLPEALHRFSKQRFGPGLEETFLESRGCRDEVIYSLLRVRDAGLARELWIRLEESETTFAEAAHQYSEGEEAQRKGVIGPMPIGMLQPPVLQEILRSLKPGEISTPRQLGEWHVLMRLEQLRSARFDGITRDHMLKEALDRFIQKRVDAVINSNQADLPPIHYDPES
jgi:hypothetical protein